MFLHVCEWQECYLQLMRSTKWLLNWMSNTVLYNPFIYCLFSFHPLRLYITEAWSYQLNRDGLGKIIHQQEISILSKTCKYTPWCMHDSPPGIVYVVRKKEHKHLIQFIFYPAILTSFHNYFPTSIPNLNWCDTKSWLCETNYQAFSHTI